MFRLVQRQLFVTTLHCNVTFSWCDSVILWLHCILRVVMNLCLCVIHVTLCYFCLVIEMWCDNAGRVLRCHSIVTVLQYDGVQFKGTLCLRNPYCSVKYEFIHYMFVTTVKRAKDSSSMRQISICFETVTRFKK
jgi:hypothetical protein